MSEILEQESGLFVESLVVDSLFTNFPLEETIDIFLNNLFKDTFQGLSKNAFRQLLHLATRESYFLFKETLNKQADGRALRLLLERTLS